MKFYKILFSYIPVVIFIIFIYINTRQVNINNPNSDYNLKIQNLNKALSLIDTKFTIKEIHPKRDEVELNYSNTIAFISFSKDLYSQVAVLQNTIKNANIKGKYIDLIDLTSANPYATLKNR